MANNFLSMRMSQLHDTEENWNKCPKFIPESGELIIYDPDESHTYPRFKIGDGVTSVINLSFGTDTVLNQSIIWENGVGYIDAGEITDYQ
jgi:hypothetical protein